MVSSAISLSTVVLFLPLIGIIPLLFMREQGADGHSNENLKWTALGFSGAAFRQPNANVKEMFNGAWADADAFNKKVKLVYISIGTAEPERMYTGVKGFHDALEAAGIKHVYYESPGTSHEWQTWRRSLRQYAGLIFKD